MIGLIISVSIPWIGNLIYVAGLSPVPGLDLTPLGFSLGAIAISFSHFLLWPVSTWCRLPATSLSRT